MPQATATATATPRHLPSLTACAAQATGPEVNDVSDNGPQRLITKRMMSVGWEAATRQRHTVLTGCTMMQELGGAATPGRPSEKEHGEGRSHVRISTPACGVAAAGEAKMPLQTYNQLCRNILHFAGTFRASFDHYQKATKAKSRLPFPVPQAPALPPGTDVRCKLVYVCMCMYV